MSTAAKPDRDARAENAFFNVEGEVHDLFHMSKIAWDLLTGVRATEIGPGGGSQLNILPWQFEQIQFAVAHTMNLASALEKAFKREFETDAVNGT